MNIGGWDTSPNQTMYNYTSNPPSQLQLTSQMDHQAPSPFLKKLEKWKLKFTGINYFDKYDKNVITF